jgi:ribose 1,5-bisphosphokinase
MAGRLIAVVGPSGVGKDSVMAALAGAHPRLGLVTRVITRAKGLGGEDYIAVTEDEFAERKAAGEFVLDWPAHGLLYGIPATVRDDLAQGQDLLINLSRGALPAAQEAFPSLITLLLTATKETLITRLSGRGRETPEDIEKRLARAAFPMPEGVNYTELSNDGAIEDTIATALSLLYPEDGET